MGTRGAWGFRISGQDKVTYCHFDSYPDGLGIAVFSFVKDCSDDELITIAKRIELIKESEKPTPEQIADCKECGSVDLKVGGRSLDDWYCLLRNSQGEPSFYKKGLKVMINSDYFLVDSLFCEWAYIINCDTKKLECYKGFNKYKSGAGRYAQLQDPGTPEYYGVKLVDELDFSETRTMSNENFLGRFNESDK